MTLPQIGTPTVKESMSNLRDHLIGFVTGVQDGADKSRVELTLGSLFGTSAQDDVPSISFGYGYHQPREVLYRLGGKYEMLDVPTAVDRFLTAYGLEK